MSSFGVYNISLISESVARLVTLSTDTKHILVKVWIFLIQITYYSSKNVHISMIAFVINYGVTFSHLDTLKGRRNKMRSVWKVI